MMVSDSPARVNDQTVDAQITPARLCYVRPLLDTGRHPQPVRTEHSRVGYQERAILNNYGARVYP